MILLLIKAAIAMAFTTANKAAILKHLNYPFQPWAVTTITNQLDRISALGSDFETPITDTLTELDAVEASIASYTTTDAGVQVKTDGQVNYAQLPLLERKNRYKTLQNDLAIACGLSLHHGGKLVRG